MLLMTVDMGMELGLAIAVPVDYIHIHETLKNDYDYQQLMFLMHLMISDVTHQQ